MKKLIPVTQLCNSPRQWNAKPFTVIEIDCVLEQNSYSNSGNNLSKIFYTSKKQILKRIAQKLLQPTICSNYTFLIAFCSKNQLTKST